jgi:glycosyltransferase involved in cell wall biosynthesis
VVQDGLNGLLVPVKDPIALAAALRRLLTDPALRRELGRQGRIRAETSFGEELVVQRIFAAYSRLAA